MNSNNHNYLVNMDLEKEPLLPPEDDKIDTTEHVLSEIEIVDTIMKASHDISLRYINREELIKVISNLHNNQQYAFSSNDFIILKNTNIIVMKMMKTMKKKKINQITNVKKIMVYSNTGTWILFLGLIV